jgi:hypothetical protein
MDGTYESVSVHSSSETLVAPSFGATYQPPPPQPSHHNIATLHHAPSPTNTAFSPTTPSKRVHDPEGLKTKLSRITVDDVLNTLVIGVFFVFLVLGFGALLGYCNFSIGCIALGKKDGRCKGTGALGGVFASVPATLGFFGVRWVYHTLDKHRRHGWSAFALVTLLPLLCIAFGIVGGVIGWAILSSADPKGTEFGIGKAIVIAVIGASSSSPVVSIALGRLAVGP